MTYAEILKTTDQQVTLHFGQSKALIWGSRNTTMPWRRGDGYVYGGVCRGQLDDRSLALAQGVPLFRHMPEIRITDFPVLIFSGLWVAPPSSPQSYDYFSGVRYWCFLNADCNLNRCSSFVLQHLNLNGHLHSLSVIFRTGKLHFRIGSNFGCQPWLAWSKQSPALASQCLKVSLWPKLVGYYEQFFCPWLDCPWLNC